MKWEVAAQDAGFSMENVRFMKPGDRVIGITKRNLRLRLSLGILRIYALFASCLLLNLSTIAPKTVSAVLGFISVRARNTRQSVLKKCCRFKTHRQHY